MNSSRLHALLVSRSKAGGWSVSRSGSEPVIMFPTKAAAIKAAQTIVREEGGVLAVRNANGKTANSFTLGRSAMAKLNAVEGVVSGNAVQKAFSAFDLVDATPAERRAGLRKDLAKLISDFSFKGSIRSDPSKTLVSQD